MTDVIPTDVEITALWNKYRLPQVKRRHVALVAQVALFLTAKLEENDPSIRIDKPLLKTAALLHDIDKNSPGRTGEVHPDTGVRILREEGMSQIADLVKTHPLHAILDPSISPKTWEEKLLFLADKMVKNDIITVDKRFELWNEEHLPPREQAVLDAALPKVKELEAEVFGRIDIAPADVAGLLTG